MVRDFQQKRKAKKLLYSRKVLLVLLVLLILLARGAWGVYEKERESRALLEVSKNRYEEAVHREEELDRNIELLSTERGKEEEIREKFSVAMPGEEVILIVESEQGKDREEKEEESLLKKILDWLLGKD